MTDAFVDALVAPGRADLPDRFFDRFMFNMHPREATAPSIIVGAGIYPGADTIDGFAVVTTASEQRNARFSTQLSATDGSAVGPLGWHVLEPMTRWRLVLARNPTGLEFDVVWEARAPAWFGDVTVRNAGTVTSSFEHLFQSGHYRGVASLDGASLDIDGWYGQRDRSRGVRTMSGGQGLHVWLQAQFAEHSIGFLLVEGRDHSRLLLEGAVMHTNGTLDPITDVRHALRFDGGLDLQGGRVDVRTESGAVYRLEADASSGGGYMAGGGYGGHHGKPAGLDHLEHDVYLLDGAVSPRTVDTALTDRLATFRRTSDSGAETGIGIFEFAHSRSPSYTYRPSLQ